MPDASQRKLTITLPADLGQPGASNVLTLAIVDDAKIAGGKRAIARNFIDANTDAPGAARRKRVEWEIWGDIGRSRYSTSGVLAIDMTRKLETRWERRLLPVGQQIAIPLDGSDPPAASSGYFGGFTFGTNTFGTLTPPFGPSISGMPVVVFAEQQGYLIAYRGQFATQVDYATWAVIESQVLRSNVLDAAFWRKHVYAAVGPTVPLQRLVAASPVGQVYEDTVATTPSQNVYASAIKRGSDRAWYVDANEGGATQNYLGFTLDGFENLAKPFQVGDPDIAATGIGPFGPFTMTGALDGLYSFTDQGKPIPLSRALLSHNSIINGQQWADPGWGWNYAITSIGLRAIQAGVDNPVGIGERMRGFTGHTGTPTAIWAERGELWMTYLTPAGDLYGYRGTFGPQTAATGQPLLFPWFFSAADTCAALFSSTAPAADPIQNAYMIRASGTNATRMLIASNGRDDLDANYGYSVNGGTAFLTTLDDDVNLLKTFRIARLRTRNMPGYGASWTLSMAFDPPPDFPETANYVQIGDPITADGAQTLQAVTNRAPTSGISGRTMKPRLGLAATTVYTNYITNPSFESGAHTGWLIGGAFTNIFASTSQALYGDYSMAFYTTSGGGTTPIAITLQSHTAYTVQVSFYIPSDWTGGTITASIADIAGTTGTITANANGSLLDQWQTLTFSFTTGTDVIGEFVVSWPSPSQSGFNPARPAYVDGVMIVNADSLTTPTVPYIDGNQGAGFAWTGTPNDSTSTWGAGGNTPPEIDGTLEVEYDERPALVEEIDVAIDMTATGYTNNYIWDVLERLSSQNEDGPFPIQLPDDYTPGVTLGSGGGQKYAMIGPVTSRQDINDGTIQAVNVKLFTWPATDAL